MQLSEFRFPKVSKVDAAFPLFDTIPDLLEEARRRNPEKGIEAYNQMILKGKKYRALPGIENSWRADALLYAKALMKSYMPKKEHKRLVVGMIFEETLDLD